MELKKIVFGVIVLLFAVCNVLLAGTKNHTRGIGVYPGNLQEYAGPSLQISNAYRNIALHRMAFHSSAYDYNLTAQLVTDGITHTHQPPYMEVITPKGKVPKREREWASGGGTYSQNMIEGERSFLKYIYHHYKVRFNKVVIYYSAAYEEAQATGEFDVNVVTQKQGKQQLLVQHKGNKFPGWQASKKVSADPNKQTDIAKLPCREDICTLKLKEITEVDNLQFNFYMKGTKYWNVYDVRFYLDEEEVFDNFASYHFHSSWMSEVHPEEWVYVDLGAKAEFNKVRLHWIQRSGNVELQTSNDAQTWVPLHAIKTTNKTADEYATQGKARYVRVLVKYPEQPVILSELEVMGKGGVQSVPAKEWGMREGNYSLNGGNWKLGRDNGEQGEQVSLPAFNTSQWIDATVPATVLSSYINIGAVPNPNVAFDNLMISESYFLSNFWYRKEFQCPSNYLKEHTYLHLDGINWKADVYLNGKKIHRQEGAFIRGKIDITPYLHKGKNVLAIKIWRNKHFGNVKVMDEYDTDKNGGTLGADNPTFHCSIGWDWITTIQGRNMGIWNDVYLTHNAGVSLSDPYVKTQLALPDTTATLTPSVFIENKCATPVQGTLKGTVGTIAFEKSVTLPANSCEEYTFESQSTSVLNNVRMPLWWPNGYGTPYLHDASFTFTSVDGRISNQICFKVGLRQVETKDSMTQMQIFVNGKRFIPLGGNWGMAESNINYRAREYDISVRYHKEMNFNMLRNWVGQTGDEELYEACDKYGILIFQDFWLANPADGPDPDDEKMFILNAEDYVKRIRQHASVGLYCGRNEGYPTKTLNAALNETVKHLHPDMTYVPSSADDGLSGHGPYKAHVPREYFQLVTPKFHTERGMPNVPCYETVMRMMHPADQWPVGQAWAQRGFSKAGAQHVDTFMDFVENSIGKATNAKQFCEWAQWVNYDGYRAIYEGNHQTRSGMLIWMSHCTMPSNVFQTYDYYYDPGAAFFACKKACEPLHIQWNPVNNHIQVVNLCKGNQPNLTACASVWDINGKRLYHQEERIGIQNDETKDVFPLEVPQKVTDTYFLQLQLMKGDQCISTNTYTIGKKEGNYQLLWQMPKVELKKWVQMYSEKAVVTLENTSQTPVAMVRLNLKDSANEQVLPVIYTDNYFHLMPGESKTITITWKAEDVHASKPWVDVSYFNMK